MVVRQAIREEALVKTHESLKGIKLGDLQARRRHGDGYANVAEASYRAGS
jgi:hypothetical protein